jgi:hypothetical protein
MKTFYNEAAVLWHQQILDCNKLADPIAYRPKPRNLSKAWRSKPVSLNDRKHARDVPRIVPTFNATSHHDAHYGRTQRALLSALKADIHRGFNPITSDDDIVILDSGCSIAITPDLTDFIDGTYAAQDNQISGIGSGLTSAGIGEVNWKFIDNDNKPVTMKLTALHVPDIPCRLLPPQQIAQQGNSTLPEGAWLGKQSAAKVFYDGHVIDFPYDKSSNLPSRKLSPGCDKFCMFIAAATDSSKTSATDAISQQQQFAPANNPYNPPTDLVMPTPSLRSP